MKALVLESKGELHLYNKDVQVIPTLSDNEAVAKGHSVWFRPYNSARKSRKDKGRLSQNNWT